MIYFVKELSTDNYGIPWTFILVRPTPLQPSPKPPLTPTQLLAVSLLTVLSLATTIVLHCLYGLSPLLNIALNSILLAVWAVGFGMLSWWSSGTLKHVCNMSNWDSDVGVAICRIYKVLFSFALCGLVATLGALVLDVRVWRTAGARGRFTALGRGDGKGMRVEVVGGADGDGDGGGVELGAAENAGMVGGRLGRGGREGYAVPLEQFDQEDSSYYGASRR
ncbi:hypothetical protein BU24DRAFT_428456 [Aaosphaeria arxii CBS 175.79]|uniref:MARVEL domain-containing protein n=1 Tax=Aaosphaeria arxii CBS 175.79 TaxID=1450172 RepID=A0A6A5X9E9_9PLEO|nr:uncharacterized protein BU24DRAFT_428456 [Aaosphaeria arxii CBS 175.79]KAF2009563.1 hypothetical protein BU24DRAFT_428456 [Aaosphaeria arxii CBS 175.79]